MWGVGGSRFVGVLLPTQAHFASGIAIELAPPTNKYILGVDESRWKLLSDKNLTRKRVSDWFTSVFFQFFSHITLLLIVLLSPLIDIWANICKSTSEQTRREYRYMLVIANVNRISSVFPNFNFWWIWITSLAKQGRHSYRSSTAHGITNWKVCKFQKQNLAKQKLVCFPALQIQKRPLTSLNLE